MLTQKQVWELDAKKAQDEPELAVALIAAIIPLEKYLFSPNGLNSSKTLIDSFTIGELKFHLRNMVNMMDDLI